MGRPADQRNPLDAINEGARLRRGLSIMTRDDRDPRVRHAQTPVSKSDDDDPAKARFLEELRKRRKPSTWEEVLGPETGEGTRRVVD